ncbi:retinol dehydrogenase 12 [Calliopsis andreniformis]|uniref:retinol dehydrogenase 12 n=1 Tax=Calliopsis andreniformis TaxID=337506 RepID=UPI003FCD205D
MLFTSSVCAIIASAIMYGIPRERWPFLLEMLVSNIMLSLLGVKETISDWIYARYNKNECPIQSGRIAIVTGGSRGIAVELVKMLLELDMEVIIACRRTVAGEKTIKQIRESGIKTGTTKVYKLDNASLKSVKQFAEEIKRDYKEIHVLVNNAGVMFCPYEETEDGFEQQWGVNYLSHFLLTILLLPLLKAGGLPQKSSRIVNVSSCAHLLGKINFKDINSKNRFITLSAYAQSKLAQVVFTQKLQNMLQEKDYNVQVYSVHPGVVLTELFVHSYLWKIKALLQYFIKTPKAGALSIAYAAVNPAIENNGGVYINNCRPSPVNPDALNPSIQDQLIELSLQQVKLNNLSQYL